jgi:hypothetical protein
VKSTSHPESDRRIDDLRLDIIVIAILGMMALANLVEFPAVERRATWISVGSRSAVSDAVELGRTHPSTSSLSTAYLLLAQVAPRATIILPAKHPFAIDNLYGLSRAKHVGVRQYGADEIPLSKIITEAVVDSQTDDNAGNPWTLSVALNARAPATLVGIKGNGIWYLVDQNLLTQHDRKIVGL